MIVILQTLQFYTVAHLLKRISMLLASTDFESNRKFTGYSCIGIFFEVLPHAVEKSTRRRTESILDS